MKLTRSTIGTFFLLAGLLTISASVFAQAELPKTKPGKSFKQSGVKFASPNEPDWRIAKAGALETEFVKTTADKKFTAFVKTAKIPLYETNDELFVNLEKRKMAENDEASRDSIHYYYGEYKSTPCLQYDGIFNAPNTGYKYRNMNGYICRHPDDKTTIIQFEFFNYSNDRGYLKPEAQLSKAFFEGIQFTKLK